MAQVDLTMGEFRPGPSLAGDLCRPGFDRAKRPEVLLRPRRAALRLLRPERQRLDTSRTNRARWRG
jgi:hypothetical protein